MKKSRLLHTWNFIGFHIIFHEISYMKYDMKSYEILCRIHVWNNRLFFIRSFVSLDYSVMKCLNENKVAEDPFHRYSSCSRLWMRLRSLKLLCAMLSGRCISTTILLCPCSKWLFVCSGKWELWNKLSCLLCTCIVCLLSFPLKFLAAKSYCLSFALSLILFCVRNQSS